MVVVGAVYFNNCNYSQAALFLQIYGGLVMGTSSLKITAYFFKNKMDHIDKIVPALEFAEFVVTIWGSIVVFSKLSFSIYMIFLVFSVFSIFALLKLSKPTIFHKHTERKSMKF